MMRWAATIGMIWGIAAMPAAAAAPRWQQASSRHFIVYSDDTPEHVRAFTTRLELDDKAMRVLHGQGDDAPSPNSRVTVFVVPTTDAVAKLAHNSMVAGFYIPRASGSIAFTPRRSDGGGAGELKSEEVLFHEYAHHFMYAALRDAVVPPWLSEGFAEFHATTDVRPDGSVLIGKVPLYRAYGIVEGANLPVSDVLLGDPARMPPDQVQMLYGRGWLLTHYFTADPTRRVLLDQYLQALQQGKPPREAARILGEPVALQRQLQIYTRQPLKVFTLPAAKLPIDPVSVRPLTAAEAAMMPALIASKRGVDAKTAPRVAAQARQLAAPYPADAAAQNELAEAEYDAKQYQAAADAADRAFAADPHSLHAMMYAGLARVAIAEAAKPADRKAVEAARGWLRRANRAEPESAWPLQAYYASYVGAGEAPTANAEDGLLYARELAPFDDQLGLAAAYIYLKRDKANEARRVLQPVAYRPHGEQASVAARGVLAVLDKDGTKAALAAMGPKAQAVAATAAD